MQRHYMVMYDFNHSRHDSHTLTHSRCELTLETVTRIHQHAVLSCVIDWIFSAEDGSIREESLAHATQKVLHCLAPLPAKH